MSEEEKKAIAQFKEIDLEDCSCEKCFYQEIEECSGCPSMIKKTLLNLIEKQQKEIENSVSKDKIRVVVKKIDAYYRMAKAGVEESQKEGYAYNPLDTGRAEAHNADRDFVEELLEE